jgi:pimeloyl-ACP methyl ester carboxylesterase
MKEVYCISGLGADRRIFKHLTVEGVNFQFVDWIPPKPGDTIQSYAERLTAQLNDPKAFLLGVSFGGMMAIELSRILPISGVVLISSVKTHSELPLWMRTCGQCKIDRLLPEKRSITTIPGAKLLRPVQNYFLGAATEEEKRIANEYRDSVDPVYLKWSINQVLNWKNDWLPSNLYHIHGDRDHIFPIKKVKPTHVIHNAGHFMVFNRYEEINVILREIFR